jgi:hypothetical protein
VSHRPTIAIPKNQHVALAPQRTPTPSGAELPSTEVAAREPNDGPLLSSPLACCTRPHYIPLPALHPSPAGRGLPNLPRRTLQTMSPAASPAAACYRHRSPRLALTFHPSPPSLSPPVSPPTGFSSTAAAASQSSSSGLGRVMSGDRSEAIALVDRICGPAARTSAVASVIRRPPCSWVRRVGAGVYTHSEFWSEGKEVSG